jgi:hypothetical protein
VFSKKGCTFALLLQAYKNNVNAERIFWVLALVALRYP